MLTVQPITQSGGRWIVVSVKILADFRVRKTYIRPCRNARLEDEMRKKMNAASNVYAPSDPPLAAKEEMRSYCLAHPGSPSAVRQPQLSSRGDLWIALLGPSAEKGIVGIGPTVEAALRAFDAKYFKLSKTGHESDENSRFSPSRS
jgi:hypothetical protein